MIVGAVHDVSVGSWRLTGVQLVNGRLVEDLRALPWPVLDHGQLCQSNVGRLPGIASSSSAARQIDEEARFMGACGLSKIEKPRNEKDDGNNHDAENNAKFLGVSQAMPTNASIDASYYGSHGDQWSWLKKRYHSCAAGSWGEGTSKFWRVSGGKVNAK